MSDRPAHDPESSGRTANEDPPASRSIDRPRRHGEPFLEPVAWVVLFVGVIGTILAFFLTRQAIERREDDRLRAAAEAFGDEVDQLTSDLQGVVSEVSGGVVATDANSTDVERLMRPIVAEDPLFTGVAVLQADESVGVSIYAETGSVRSLEALAESDPTELQALVDQLSVLEPGELAIISSERIDDFDVVDLATPVPNDPRNLVVVVEMSIPTTAFDELTRAAGSTDYAMYLSSEADRDDLLFASTDELPLNGRQVRQSLAVADQEGLLVTAATGELVSRAEETIPYVILVVGLMVTATTTPLVHGFTRRRRQVRELSREKDELDQALAVARRIEKELRASEQRFRSVLTSSPDVILWMDPDGTHVQVLNRDDFFGHPGNEVEDAESFVALIHPEDWPSAEQGFKHLRWSQPGSITEFEFRLRDPDGVWRWVIVRGGVASLGEGTEPYILVVFTEITEQKREEQRRAELEAQLVQSQRLEAVGQLAGGVAHDFNNILAAILSGADLMLDDLPDGEMREDVLEIQRTARRGADLSRQLLLFSRGEASSSPEVIDVNDVVRDMERMLDRSIGERIELRTELAEDLDPIFADKGEIERIIMNLTLNARDAMPEHGGTITVRTANADVDDDFVATRVDLEAGQYVRIDVADTGHGMEPDVIRRAFEPFFSTKDVGKGTGLGLSTVYGIVQRKGGHIEIESEPGNGTTMSLLLPITRLRDPAPRGPKADKARYGAGERLLVVEDEEAVRTATQRLLERRGYVVDAVENGEEAGAAAGTSRYDLLLTDVLLPGGMSGKDVADVLKQRQPHLGVLFMTGHSGEVLEAVGLQAGDPRIIQKPFEEGVLLEAVRTTLDVTMAATGGHR